MGRKKATIKKDSDGISGWGLVGIIALFGFILFIYSFAWIPAIPTLIYLFKSKKYEDHRIRNVSICAAVIATSFILFVYINAPKELEEINAVWETTEFVEGEKINVSIEPVPADAKIKQLSLVDNNVAKLKYNNGIATLTFTDTGTAKIQFIANKKISSDLQEVTVISKEEQKARKEKEKQEALLALTPTATPKPTATPIPTIIPTETPVPEPTSTPPSEEMVWVSGSGSKYHSNSSCSNMSVPTEITISDAESRGYEPCKKCY